MAEEARDEREQAVEAVATVATPEEKAKVGVVEDSVVSTVTAAQSLQVRNADEASAATEVLARIAGEKKRAEEARTFLVRPLNEHVKAINDRFRGPRQMLEQADAIIRRKVLDWQQEQERRRAEEQARLDAERRAAEARAEEERRAAEAKARAEREAAAREAARKEAEARAAERRRQEELAAKASQRRLEIAYMRNDELKLLIDKGDQCGNPDDARMADEEFAARAAARALQEESVKARQREEEARAREEEERSRPLPDQPKTVVAPAAPLRSGLGSASSRKVWKATVVDPERVPRAYLVVDEKAINRAVRDGVREIAGVRIEQVPELAVRTR